MKLLVIRDRNYLKHRKRAHVVRSMMKRHDRELLGRYKSLGLDLRELAPVPPHMSQVRANREYMGKKIAHAEELRKRGEVDFFNLMCGTEGKHHG